MGYSKIKVNQKIGNIEKDSHVIGVQNISHQFDKTILNHQWFTNHIEDAANQAGERYSPKLSVKVPMSYHLEAFGMTSAWISACEEKRRAIKKEIDDLQGSLGNHSKDSPIPEFPFSVKNTAEALMTCLKKIYERLISIPDQPLTSTEISDFKAMICQSIKITQDCEDVLVADLEDKHGKGVADSESFRQFQAGYMCRFPACHVDTMRDINKNLKEIQEWLDSPEAELPGVKAMLIQGPAGVGKTHGIIDHAFSRLNNGLKSIVIFGEDFSDSEPWIQVISKLGLGLGTRPAEFLDAIDALAEDSGYPVIIFIDALNETRSERIGKTGSLLLSAR